MDDGDFLQFALLQHKNEIEETNMIFDRSSKMVGAIALLGGVSVYLSSFEYLDKEGVIVIFYYAFMLVNAVFLAVAAISLAIALKSRIYDNVSSKKWLDWRRKYEAAFTDEMGISDREMQEVIAKASNRMMSDEAAKYAAKNRITNDRRRLYVDIAVSIATYSLLLIFAQALCKLVIDHF